MISISRLQAYFRYNAQQQYESVFIPHFALFFHPIDNLPYFNYAIPLESHSTHVDASLSLLKNEFAERKRTPRFEFVEEFAPLLPGILRRTEFHEEARQQLMICQVGTYRPVSETARLQITELSNASPIRTIQKFLHVQKRGFNPQDQGEVALAEAEQFRRMLGKGRGFLARFEGQIIGVGMYSTPFDGISEVVGLATLEQFRRRGIATRLAGQAVKRAMEEGAEVVCLTAADAQAGRVYEKVGFRSYATMLAYIEKYT